MWMATPWGEDVGPEGSNHMRAYIVNCLESLGPDD